jgi:acetyltransferase-like isoleucine patch superfamily enzyme
MIREYLRKFLKVYHIFLQKFFYPNVKIKSTITFWEYVFPQKILNLHGSRRIPWPVHFTSIVHGSKNITIGEGTAPGRSAGAYIQAINGIKMGTNIYMAPSVKIISANHKRNNLAEHEVSSSIEIGDNCWLGVNCIILPGVSLGANTIVAAGAVVTKSFPEGNITIAGVPAKEISK